MNGISDVNPLVGPRPIQQGEALYGREAEVRELYNQLQARRIVVLHSPSGAGKSSLVQAGLIPYALGIGSLVVLHGLTGTPEVLLTVLPSAIISLVYGLAYTANLARVAGGSRTERPTPLLDRPSEVS